MGLPKVGDTITAVERRGRKVFVFSKDWHVVLEDRYFVYTPAREAETTNERSQH